MSLPIGDKTLVIRFSDAFKEKPAVSINGTVYNGSYFVDNITTQDVPLNVSFSNFHCRYSYSVNVTPQTDYKSFTLSHGFDGSGKCSLSVGKLPNQTSEQYALYSSQVMKNVKIAKIEQSSSPYYDVSVGGWNVVGFAGAFLTFLLLAITVVVHRDYKKGLFVDKHAHANG